MEWIRELCKGAMVDDGYALKGSQIDGKHNKAGGYLMVCHNYIIPFFWPAKLPLLSVSFLTAFLKRVMIVIAQRLELWFQ